MIVLYSGFPDTGSLIPQFITVISDVLYHHRPVVDRIS